MVCYLVCRLNVYQSDTEYNLFFNKCIKINCALKNILTSGTIIYKEEI